MTLRAVAEINLAALERNVATLAGRIGPSVLCAVVKADGYGHGAVEVARAALGAGAGALAVATAGEALALREAGVAGGRLIVLGALSAQEVPVALAAGAELVAWDERFVRALAGHRVGLHVKFDSGMGRLGTRDPAAVAAVAAVIETTPGPELVGVCTHFATSDGDLDFTRAQLAAFTPVAAGLARPGVTVHAANSAAVLRLPASHLDMVRTGIALYGADPLNEDPSRHGLEPVLSLRSYVAAVKPVRAGESAGYGRRFIASADGWLATVPIGYADGVSRRLTNNCDVLINGRRHPLVGTVSMDNITVDLGATTTVAVGDPVTLIGADGSERQTVEALAHRLDTINYEVLCAIGARVPRHYHRDGAGL
ncbi:alanine racemase [Conexibacter sp. DBS9H8]|uniref:alanine racemase n=1 Tax=Conexibacter sp. DBS9H8 TaxID=2937801 RepID=UPI00200CAFDE|nr:alanine racemase [Conexibacter sp. DBS9H8]